MKQNILALTLLALTSAAMAGGLTDPEVVPLPMTKELISCEGKSMEKKSDYNGAFYHYSLALNQSSEEAAESAANAVRAYLEARKQTCNPNAKAVIDRNGYAVRKTKGGIVINLP